MDVYPWLMLIGLLVVVGVFLPRYGLGSRFQAWQAAREREQLEDALKHLLDREQEGRHASPGSLAGALQVNPRRALLLIARLEAQGLLETRGHELHLTPAGERWALHVVRAHRLWERYLADEARMPLEQVHRQAHRREHTLTDSDLDALDAALGHPASDPHGDPIPDPAGRLRSLQATPLTSIEGEGPLRIVHLEDEPEIAYAQILAEGLRLGQVIRLVEKTPLHYLLSDGESEFRLAPSVAANVQVTRLSQPEAAEPDVLPLWQLPQNQPAEIAALDAAVQGFTRRRFLDLGLTPGTRITPELDPFFGDPRAYRVRGTLIALRKDQAAQIWVKPV